MSTMQYIDTMQEAILAGELGDNAMSSTRAKSADNVSTKRKLVVTPASAIKMKPVYWLWQQRIAMGELTLVAGREGIGKSTLVNAELVAWITTGTMKGIFLGIPKSVIIAATEDSWEHTLVPRLVAAGADLSRVFRVDVETTDIGSDSLVLPKDIKALEEVVSENDVALVILDPLMSRLSTSLDSHKDAEVRVALEPLTAFAKRANVAIIGLIHLNKSTGTDSLNLIMGSKAFSAVARSVLVAMKDPMDDSRVVLGLEKSNLGSRDVKTYVYKIVSKLVGVVDGVPIETGVVEWLGDSDRSISQMLEEKSMGDEVSTAVGEAKDWLEDYLTINPYPVESLKIKDSARKAGHSLSALDRARKKLPIRVNSSGMPRVTSWQLISEDTTKPVALTIPEPNDPFGE